MAVALWWIRRDLRLEDNQVLQAVQAAGYQVLPVFIQDPHLLRKPAANRQDFLLEALASLDAGLQHFGSRLILRQGEPVEELGHLLAETGAEKVFAEEDYSPYARRRDEAAARRLPLSLVTGAVVHPPQMVRKQDGSPFKVFTPFYKVWLGLPVSSPRADKPGEILLQNPEIPSLPISLLQQPGNSFPASEGEAQRRLYAFTSGPVYDYEAGRDRLDWDGTSSLSPYLRFGLISPRKAAAAARDAMQAASDAEAHQSAETWLRQLAWREFYTHILYHFPHVLKTAFNPALRDIAWRDAPADLQAWETGLTGFPVVDACMRQLLSLGWMHNRGRMITASFLVKDLLIDWKEGEAWFMRSLVDGDPASNSGGWQWTAGVGTDAAPYFRILNPVSQSKKWDPEGTFIRRWVPELARVPGEFIHEPWQMPQEIQHSTTCRIGKDYPAPIVNHASAKERVIASYKRAYLAFRLEEHA